MNAIVRNGKKYEILGNMHSSHSQVVGTIITYELVLVQFQMMIPQVEQDYCTIKTAAPN